MSCGVCMLSTESLAFSPSLKLVPARRERGHAVSSFTDRESAVMGVMAPKRCLLLPANASAMHACTHPECGSQQADLETQDALLIM